MLEPTQIEMLILKRVRKLMRHDWFLPVDINPIGEMKLPCLWFVITGNLFGQQSSHQRAVLKILRHQPKFLERDLGRMHVRRRNIFIKIFDDRAFDLSS